MNSVKGGVTRTMIVSLLHIRFSGFMALRQCPRDVEAKQMPGASADRVVQLIERVVISWIWNSLSTRTNKQDILNRASSNSQLIVSASV